MGILLSWTNHADAAETNISVDSEALGLGLRALLRPQIADVWRSNAWGTSTINLRLDLGSVKAIGAIALAAPRDSLLPGLSAGVRVTADAAVLDGNAAFDTITIGAHNLLLYSEDFTSVWTVNAATVQPAMAVGPFGQISATGLADTLANTNHYVQQQYVIAPAKTYTLAVYLKAAAASAARLTLICADSSNASGCNCDLTAGSASITPTGMITGTLVESAGAGWWRCSVTFTTPASLTSTTLNLRIQAGTAAYPGTGNTQILIGGAHLEQAAKASAYIVTAGVPMSLMQSIGVSMARFGLWGWAGTAFSARYLWFRFTGGAADAYLQLGRLWVGPALITARNAAYGFGSSANDPGSNARAGVTGIRDGVRGRPYRSLSFTCDGLTAAEAAQLEQAAIAVGTTGQVLAARLDSDIAATGCFGVCAKGLSVTRASFPAWRGDFAIEEDL